MKRRLKRKMSSFAGAAVIAFALVAAGGCQSGDSGSPSPAPQKQVSQPPASGTASGPAAPSAPRAASGIQAPNLIDFTEGVKGEFQLDAWVPAPGHAIVTLEGLPDGATFDAGTNKLTWTPPLGAADDPAHPGNSTRYLSVKLTVKSDADPALVLTQDMTLIVHQAPRTTHIILAGSTLPLPEGQEYDGLIKIESQDTPDGTFTMKADGLPLGATIEKGRNGREFMLRYTPDRTVVTTKDTWNPETRQYEKTVEIVYHAYNAGGAEVAVKRQLLKIADSRIGPVFSGADSVSASETADFTVSAVDGNGEQAPVVALISGPEQGHYESLSRVDGLSNQIEIRWSGIPRELMGRSVPFQFQACTGAASDDTLRCTLREVRVNVAEAEHHAPVVQREFWKSGLTRFVRQGDLLEAPVSVIDGDSTDNPVDLLLSSSVSGDQVDFMNQRIRIREAATAGPRTITLTARSTVDPKLTTTETFQLFVLPPAKANE